MSSGLFPQRLIKGKFAMEDYVDDYNSLAFLEYVIRAPPVVTLYTALT